MSISGDPWIESVPGAVLVLSPDGSIRSANSTAAGLFGVAPEQLRGRPFEAFLTDSSRTVYQAASARALTEAEQRGGRFLSFHAKRGGDEVPIQVGFGKSGDDGALVLACRDATEVARLRDEASAQQRHYLAAADMLTADVLQVINLKDDRMTFHGDIDRLTRDPSGDFPRTLSGWQERIHPEDRERIDADYESVVAANAAPEWDWHYRLRAGDGSYIHLWDRGKFTVYEGKTPIEGFGAVSDETQEVARREQLERAESHAEATRDLNDVVLASMNEPLVVVNEKGVIVTVNEAWSAFQRTRRDAGNAVLDVGANYLEVCRGTAGSSNDGKLALGLQSVLDGITPRFQLEHQLHSASPDRWFSTVAVPLEHHGGAVVTHRDITEQVTARKKLERTVSDVSAQRQQLKADAQYLRHELESRLGPEGIAGSSPALQAAIKKVEQVAGTDSTVLLCGETGTGKELLARAVHSSSHRSKRPLIKVDCANLPSGLIESELFGHEKGAFTGAVEARAGRFELADGGTIFLDEIGELPLELQSKLLRVLEEGRFQRLGSKRERQTDVRVIVATNRELEAEVREGRFRADLYYRLAVFPIGSPPLRQRREDIPLLASLFLSRMKGSKKITSIEPASLDRLVSYDWPGNVRELRNVIERAVILCSGEVLTIDEASGSAAEATPTDAERKSGLLRQDMQSVERATILRALEESNWKVKGADSAASRLGLSPSTLRYRMAKLGIERPKPRKQT